MKINQQAVVMRFRGPTELRIEFRKQNGKEVILLEMSTETNEGTWKAVRATISKNELVSLVKHLEKLLSEA